MHPSLSAYLRFLDHAGVQLALSPQLRREPDHQGPLIPSGPSPRSLLIAAETSLREYFAASSGIAADHASLSVARSLLDLRAGLAGLRVVEVGCGTAILSVLAARSGARVSALDVDPEALELARRTAQDNGVTIDLRLGSLLDPLPPGERVNMFLANLPHKPTPNGQQLNLAQAGGPEGDALWQPAAAAMSERQEAGDRILFFLHSLPHPRLLKQLQGSYDLLLCRWKLRWLAEDEYPSLRQLFRDRHARGCSFLARQEAREALLGGVWQATRRGNQVP